MDDSNLTSDLTTVTTENAVLGVVIAKLRESHIPPVKQQELAAALGLSPSAWSRVEKGDSELSALQLLRITAILEVSANEIFDLVNLLSRSLNQKGIEIKSQDVWRQFVATKVAVSSGAAIAGLAQIGILPLVGPALAGLAGSLLGSALKALNKK